MKLTHCKLNQRTQRKLLEYFVLEVTTCSAADLCYRKTRQVTNHHLAQQAYGIFDGLVELDKSYFGDHRKGKRSRGAAGNVVVFGILKRNVKVYTDRYRSYDVLDVSEFSHCCINHSKQFADRQNHINDIENFWSQAKRGLRK